MYIDGTLVKTGSHAASTLRNLSAPITLGTLNSGYATSHDGNLDDVRIYRGKALTQSEIQTVMAVNQ